MELAFTSMNTPEELAPDALARALEERGFGALFMGEHSHIPVSRKTPYPAGGELPAPYKRMMDPFVSLTLAATATSTLRLGTGVALPLEHDLFDLAKSVATLDRVAQGRLEFGVGVGWNEEELANHRPGLAWKQRYRALAECVAALHRLWSDEEAAFHGEFFDFDAVWSFPKPLQEPHPPVLCGTSGKLGSKHAVDWADDWMPMDIGLGNVARKVALFRSACEEAGRGRLPISLVTFGDPDLATLTRYAEMGIERAVVGSGREGWDDPATTLPFLDRYAGMIPALR